MLVVFQIYLENASRADVTRSGKDARPFVLSTGPDLYIKFYTGADRFIMPYVGFKAAYSFVNGSYLRTCTNAVNKKKKKKKTKEGKKKPCEKTQIRYNFHGSVRKVAVLVVSTA